LNRDAPALKRPFTHTRSVKAAQQDLKKPVELRTQAPEDVPRPPPDTDIPAYQITFTCKPCLTRSSHRISKHGYHNGSVLIQCPNCKNRHVITDHLKVFGEKARSFEEILKEAGETLREKKLDGGDIEFWYNGEKMKRVDEPGGKKET